MERYKTATLLNRLYKYDEKYYEQITKPDNIGFGYAMRAYHSLKMSNPPEWKTRDKATAVAEELTKRNVKFRTNYLRLSN